MTATNDAAALRVRTPQRSRRPWNESSLAAALVSPTLLVLAVVIVYPTLQAVRDSLYGTPGLDPSTGFVTDTAPFVGLGNYVDIFSDAGSAFWNATKNTTMFTIVCVGIESVLGTAMALVMHQALRMRGLVRAGILVPWAIPTVASALLWRWIFDANGVANGLLPGQILWSAEGIQSQIAVVIADVWKTAPFIGLLVLAGLQLIPAEVHEAAEVDGASAWRRLISITLPLVKPALLVAVLFRMLDTLRMFDLPYVLIGPRKTSVETLSMLAQNEAANTRYGPAAAYAVVLFLYALLIAVAFIKVLGADLIGDAADRAKTRRRAVRQGKLTVQP